MNTDIPAELIKTGLPYSKVGTCSRTPGFPNFGLTESTIGRDTQFFASKYKLLLPSEEELRAEITAVELQGKV